jgi:hypothetical protein
MAVQPVYGPDYAKLVLQGLQTYRGIKGQQQQDEQYESQQQRQRERDIREEERYQRQKELEMREDEDFKLKRFQRERATTARKIEGKPVAYQIQEMEAHIQRIKDRGGDSRESENLLEMLRNQDPAQQQAAQQIISDARVLGEDQGILKRRPAPPVEDDILRKKRAIEAGLKPGTEAYNKYMLLGEESLKKETPQTLTAIEKNVKAMGFKPGTKRYQQEVMRLAWKGQFKKTEFEKLLDMAGIDPKSDEGQRAIKAKLAGSGMSLTFDPETGEMIFTQGQGAGTPLARGSKGKIEGQLANIETNIGELNRIEELYKPEFLTWAGKGKAFWTNLKSKADVDLSKEEKQFSQGRRRFTQDVNKFFNAYRKEITGAAASVQELESLKKAVFNEDLSPVEFEAAFDEFNKGVYRSRRILRKVMREGVQGSLKNKKSPAAKRFNDLWTSGQDDSAVDRIGELKRKANSLEEIQQILKEEGYING